MLSIANWLKFSFLIKYTNCIRVLSTSILILSLFIACGGDNKEYVNLALDKDKVPSIQDDSVTLLISDSGIIRYMMITKQWLVFDRIMDPYWHFPEGIYIEQFDSLHTKEASIVADTAWNFIDRKMWHLKGHIFMKNSKEETFKTDELFWNETEQRIYSDKYIEIHRPDKLTLKGTGFESNTSMTRYRIYKPFDSPFIFSEGEGKTP
ncbi:MAG: export transporter periplasmic protein LptC [Bacteroidota bacterium]|jgi:LPS export ABC transporter protein LptC